MQLYGNIYGGGFDGKPVFEMLSNADLQYIIHIDGTGTQVDDVIPVVKQPLFRSIFISRSADSYEPQVLATPIKFGKLLNLLDCYFLNTSSQEQTFSLHVKDITGIDHSCKLRCSEGSCKSFLCSTESREFYEWFFSNSLFLKHLKLKVCATGTEVINDLSNLDFQVQHLELNCNHNSSLPSAAILSIRELQALTLLNVSVSGLCAFLTSALQSKLNLHFLSLDILSSYECYRAHDQWNLTELFYLIFSFPELEILKYGYLTKELLSELLLAWRHCGGGSLSFPEMHMALNLRN